VGRIRVDIQRNRGQLEVTVADDGRGIEVPLVMAAARAARAPQYRDDLGAEEALMLIALPGVSTAPQVTPLSGRGIGMSVVAENVRRLSGELSIESQPGEGTRIRITIPTGN
jgi:chemotaxis protein histidine kinase CheA